AFNFAAANDYGTHMEIPQYDDNGDTVSHPFPTPNGGDGSLGNAIVIGTTPRYFLTTTINGSGSVTASSPGYLNLFCSAGKCSQSYKSDANVTIAALPSTGYCFSFYGGDCSGKGNCSVKMDSSRTVTATIILPGTNVNGSQYCTLSEAYAVVADGSVLMAKAVEYYEDVVLDRGVSFSFRGGYDDGFW